MVTFIDAPTGWYSRGGGRLFRAIVMIEQEPDGVHDEQFLLQLYRIRTIVCLVLCDTPAATRMAED